MLNINTESIRLNIDIASNANAGDKSLPNSIAELQTGSLLRGIISSVNKNGDAILATKYGNFVVNNINQDIKTGDRITINILENNQQSLQLVGQFISVNDNKVNNNFVHRTEFTLSDAHPMQSSSNISLSRASTSAVIVDRTQPAMTAAHEQHSRADAPIHLPLINPAYAQSQYMKTIVSYINLSKIGDDPVLSSIVQNIKVGDRIGLVVLSPNNSDHDEQHHHIIGEVISDDTPRQLIKTIFGILEIDGKARILPSGTKLSIAIMTINDKSIKMETPTMHSLVEDFLFKFNQNLPKLQQLLPVITDLSRIEINPTTTQVEHYNKQQAVRFSDIELANADPVMLGNIHKLCELASSMEGIIRDLSADIEALKSHIIPEEQKLDQQTWYKHNFIVNDDQNTKQHEIFVQKSAQLVRFLVVINAEHVGEMQLDGLLEFAVQKKVSKFHLVIRSKKRIGSSMQNGIVGIFEVGRLLGDIKGHLSFEQAEEFIVPEN